MTQREQAQELGISQPQVCRYRRQGMPADVPAGRAWMAQHVNLRVTTGLDREGQLRRRRREQEEEEQDRPMDMGDAFVNAALFANIHGLERYMPMLRHLYFLVDDKERDRVEAEGEVPSEVWAAWEQGDDGDGPAPH